MKKTVPLLQIEKDILDFFVTAEKGRLRKSGGDILEMLKKKHPESYLETERFNVADALKRLEGMTFLQRVNGVTRPEGERGGAPRVTRQLNKEFHKNVEIQVVLRRERKPRAKAEKNVDESKPIEVQSLPVEIEPAEFFQPNETLEEVEKVLAEKDAHIAELKKNHAKLVFSLNEMQANVEISKLAIDEAEYGMLEDREVVQRAMDSFAALKKLLPKKD